MSLIGHDKNVMRFSLRCLQAPAFLLAWQSGNWVLGYFENESANPLLLESFEMHGRSFVVDSRKGEPLEPRQS
jgi:hypothetical protein